MNNYKSETKLINTFNKFYLVDNEIEYVADAYKKGQLADDRCYIKSVNNGE